MIKRFLLFFLAAVIIAGCVNLPAPPPQFAMYCDTCGRVTDWGVGEDYFYCVESGTAWNPAVGKEAGL